MAVENARRSGWSRNALLGVAVAAFGGLIGAKPLSDNSFLTHLTTGRLMLQGYFPSTDPYSFTAHGHPWVIQSWFASLLYGVADKLAGGLGIRMLVVSVSIVLALTCWRLTRRAKTVVPRLLSVIPALLVGTSMWGSRPLLFGLLCFALLVLVLEEERDPRWLVPLMWVWVNTHGSFPLGIVLIVVVAFGAKLDGHDISHAISTLKWAVLGLAVSALNPIGPRLLWFPFELLTKQDVLSHMAEWQAPGFQSNWQRVFLVSVVVVAMLAPRLTPARRYRVLIPGIVFAASGLYSMRNIPSATVVISLLLACEIRGLGSILGSVRKPFYRMVGIGEVALFAVLVVVRLGGPSFKLADFPVNQIDWLQSHGRLTPTNRIAAQDVVGNYLTFRTDGHQPVFVDDRVDMFPKSVVSDELTLIHGTAGWEKVLDRWDIDSIVWAQGGPLTSLLAASPTKWKLAYKGPANQDNPSVWDVYVRIKPPASGATHR